MKKLLIGLVLVSAAAGCTSVQYTHPSGASLSYKSSFFQKKINHAEISTNGAVIIDGYASDAAALVNALSAATIAAAKTALK